MAQALCTFLKSSQSSLAKLLSFFLQSAQLVVFYPAKIAAKLVKLSVHLFCGLYGRLFQGTGYRSGRCALQFSTLITSRSSRVVAVR